MERYRTILADPPWLERGGGKSKRGADGHYRLLDKKQIVAEMRSSLLWRPDHGGCHLWLWATSNFLKDALWVMEVLGFEYKTSAVWVKVTGEFSTQEIDDLTPVSEIASAGLQIGLGQYMRHGHEWLLFGTMGEAIVPPPAVRQPSVIFAERTKHSRKPDESFALIERTSRAPRLEMFSRETRPGWCCWGDEV